MAPRRVVVVLVMAILAAPGAAFAQSAGDEQYQDPFAGDEQEQATPTPTPAPDTPVSSDDGTQAGAQATPTPTPAPVAGSAVAAQEQLPRTGADAGLIALSGALLLAGGVALRVRVR